MCGIFGWSFSKKARVPVVQAEVLASVLALANSQRGTDSWGVYLVDRRGKYQVVKQVGDITEARGISGWGSFPVVMAHTRAATTGEKTVANAHPFREGNIVLAHNGIISNHRVLQAKYQRNCQVDSEHILLHLVNKLPMTEIEGYGSVEYADVTRPNEVRLCRMAGGSLAVYGVRDDHGKQIGTVWSSDEEHLKNALGAARLGCYPYAEPREGVVYLVRKGVLYSTSESIEISEMTWGLTSPQIDRGDEREPVYVGYKRWIYRGVEYRLGEDERFYDEDDEEVPLGDTLDALSLAALEVEEENEDLRMEELLRMNAEN